MKTSFTDYPILPKNRRRPPLDGPPKPYGRESNIKCSCGWISHVPSGPNLLYLPDDVVCPQCGAIVVFVTKVTL